MKEAPPLVLASLIALASAGSTFAQAKPTISVAPASPQQKAEGKAENPQLRWVSGLVMSTDVETF
jgi:hypothetical protein